MSEQLSAHPAGVYPASGAALASPEFGEPDRLAYLDYWEDFAEKNHKEEKVAIDNGLWLQEHRYHILNPSLHAKPISVLNSARRYYRSLGQHNTLEGGEEDLLRLVHILSVYSSRLEDRGEWKLEEASILVDLARAEGIDDKTRKDSVRRARTSLGAVAGPHKNRWLSESKLAAAMLDEDLVFDELFEDFRRTEPLKDPETGEVLKDAAYDPETGQLLENDYVDELENKFKVQLLRNMQDYLLAKIEFDVMPRRTQTQINRKNELSGFFLEWAFILTQRYIIYKRKLYAKQRIHHSTLRQDEAADNYSYDETKLSDNFDVIIEDFDASGKVDQRLYQLKTTKAHKAYRPPIQVPDRKNNLSVNQYLASIYLQREFMIGKLDDEQKRIIAKAEGMFALAGK